MSFVGYTVAPLRRNGSEGICGGHFIPDSAFFARRSFVTLCVTKSHNQTQSNLVLSTMPSHGDRSRSGLQPHGKGGRHTLRPVQEKRGRSSLDWRDPVRGLKRGLVMKSRDLDIRGLGAKLCELLGVRSGDTIAFHLLQDGSVRVINCSIMADDLPVVCPAV